MLDTIEREKVSTLIIVGDAFARPLTATLDEHPGRWDLSSLFLVISSGVMWSQETKDAFLKHHPGVLLYDTLGSSEAVGLGVSVSSAGASAGTAALHAGRQRPGGDRRRPRRRARLGRDGPRGAAGATCRSGTTRTRSSRRRPSCRSTGTRYSIPGDYATVEEDGTFTLLGRGSVCINTGGEKVFPEEVEEVLKLHPSVVDAVVVGLPDDKFGEAITAVVEAQPDEPVDEADIIAHVKGKLASFKAPQVGGAHRHDRPGPQRQGRLQAHEGLRRRDARRADPDGLERARRPLHRPPPRRTWPSPGGRLPCRSCRRRLKRVSEWCAGPEGAGLQGEGAHRCRRGHDGHVLASRSASPWRRVWRRRWPLRMRRADHAVHPEATTPARDADHHDGGDRVHHVDDSTTAPQPPEQEPEIKTSSCRRAGPSRCRARVACSRRSPAS